MGEAPKTSKAAGNFREVAKRSAEAGIADQMNRSFDSDEVQPPKGDDGAPPPNGK